MERPLRVLDQVARLGSGASSRGLERYWVLLAPGPESQHPVILELKQLLPSPIDRSDGCLARADATEIVAARVACGAGFNPLLGSFRLQDTAFLAREREAEKGTLRERDLDSRQTVKEAVEQAALVLARAHSRSPGSLESLREWIGNEPGVGREALTRLAAAYYQQTMADHQAFSRRPDEPGRDGKDQLQPSS